MACSAPRKPVFTKSQQLMIEDGLPPELLIPQSVRNDAWRDFPLRSIPLFDRMDRTRNEDEATAAFRAQVEEEKKQKARAQIARMKNRFAAKEIDHSKMRWDPRKSRFVEDRFGVKPAAPPVEQPKPKVKQQSYAHHAEFLNGPDTVGAIDWSRVNKDNAEAVARLNGVWKDSYEKLRGTGRIVMTVCNVLKGKVRRGEEVRWN